MNKHDITTQADVKRFVDEFYDRVRNDDLLAPVFNERIKGSWTTHLQTMYAFWNTILLGEFQYQGTPFLKHADLPVDSAHFATWVRLFNAVIDDLFQGPKATEAKWRAGKMAQVFESKIVDSKNRPFKPLI